MSGLKPSKIKTAPPGPYLYIVEGKGVKGLVRTELEGKAYEAFRAMGMRVPGRVLEAGEGEGVVERGGSVSGNR